MPPKALRLPPSMFLAGATLDKLPGPKYLAALRFAELALRPPLPRAPTLRQKRGALPKRAGSELVLSLRAPQSALVGERGALRFDAKMEAGLAWLIAARDALDARFVVLPTPADLTPGARSRELLAAFVARLPRDPARPFVWAPRGAWERDRAEGIANELGLVLAFDPLEEACPLGPIAYARLIAIGARRTFSPAALEEALHEMPAVEGTSRYAVIESERAFPQACTLQRIADGEVAEAGSDESSADEDEEEDETDGSSENGLSEDEDDESDDDESDEAADGDEN